MKNIKLSELVFYLVTFSIYAFIFYINIPEKNPILTISLYEKTNQLILLLTVLYPLLIVVSGVLGSFVKAKIIIIQMITVTFISLAIMKYFNISAIPYLFIYIALLQIVYTLTNRIKNINFRG